MTEKDFKQIFPLGEKNDAYALRCNRADRDVAVPLFQQGIKLFKFCHTLHLTFAL